MVNGHADLAGVDRQLIQTFSRRRAAIVAHMHTRGETSAAAAQTATLATLQAQGERSSEAELRLTLCRVRRGRIRGSRAADITWLAEAAGRGLVILTRDGNLYVNEHERLALERYRDRVFWIGPKKGTGQDWAGTFEAHQRAIVRYALARASSRSSSEDSSGRGRDPGRSACDGPAPDPVTNL